MTPNWHDKLRQAVDNKTVWLKRYNTSEGKPLEVKVWLFCCFPDIDPRVACCLIHLSKPLIETVPSSHLADLLRRELQWSVRHLVENEIR